MTLSLVVMLSVLVMVSFVGFEASLAVAAALIFIDLSLGTRCSVSLILSLDKMSHWMVALTLMVYLMCISYINYKVEKAVLISIGTLLANLYFIMSDLFWFYVTFEMSLIPVFAIIVLWGPSPERALASIYMMMYTLISSVPLIVVAVSLKLGYGAVSLSALALVSFLVKVPIWLLHSWLPRAHVEAPLEGSMLLAGVMLKLGVFGVVRVLMSLPSGWMNMGAGLIYSVSMIGVSLALVSAIGSDDLKASVAYSSISHMNLVIAALMTFSELSSKASTIMMVSHGVVSPLLFFIVTKSYMMTNSRSVLLNLGSISVVPYLKGLTCFLWALNFSVPPTLAFMGELMLGSCVVSVSVVSGLLVFAYLLLSGAHGAYMYSLVSHSFKEKSGLMSYGGQELSLTVLCFAVIVMSFAMGIQLVWVF